MKVLAVDFGDARTGLAVSDPTGFLTGETTVLHERDVQKVLDAVTAWAKARNVERIVVGRPMNMNGTEGFRAEKSAVFAEKLGEQSGIQTVLWDERLSSVGANKILSDAGKKKKKQKALVDAVAASLILESYLDYLRAQKL